MLPIQANPGIVPAHASLLTVACRCPCSIKQRGQPPALVSYDGALQGLSAHFSVVDASFLRLAVACMNMNMSEGSRSQ